MIMEKKIKMPGTRVLLDVYEENPYEMNETESGFKLTKGEFDNPDSGDRETKNPGVLCAKVVEVGVDCKAVTEGCDVYVPAAVLKPVVVNDKTYFIVFEENLLLIFE